MLNAILFTYICLVALVGAYLQFRLRRHWAAPVVLFAIALAFLAHWLAGLAGWS